MRLVLIGVLTATVLVTSTVAKAQTPDPAVGRKVWITMTDASVHRGTVLRVNPETLTLARDGVTTAVARQDVRRIEASDGVRDGVTKGAVAVGIIGAVGAGFLNYSMCSHNRAFSTIKTGLVGGAMGAAAGAIVGGLLDVANPGRQVIFERTTVTVAPVLSRQGRSVSVLVRW